MSKRKRILEIEWLDSRGVTAEWEHLKGRSPMKPSKCRSVGYVLRDKEDRIEIAQSMGGDQVLGRMVIPKCCILKVGEL